MRQPPRLIQSVYSGLTSVVFNILQRAIMQEDQSKVFDSVLPLYIQAAAELVPNDLIIDDPRDRRRKIKHAHRHINRKFEGTGRNATCPCGSGKKYKKCCIDDEQSKQID